MPHLEPLDLDERPIPAPTTQRGGGFFLAVGAVVTMTDNIFPTSPN